MFPLEFQPGTERRKYEQKGIFSTPSKKLHAGSGPRKHPRYDRENQNKYKKEIQGVFSLLHWSPPKKLKYGNPG